MDNKITLVDIVKQHHKSSFQNKYGNDYNKAKDNIMYNGFLYSPSYNSLEKIKFQYKYRNCSKKRK